MTSGEGGAVITSNLEFYERAQSYVNCGRASVTDKFRHRLIGFNYRITEFQAALLEQQLATVTHERDSLRSRLNAARSRIDALIERLPADAGTTNKGPTP